MTKYTLVCDEGHDAEVVAVEAESEEIALKKMMVRTKEHNKQKHLGVSVPDKRMEKFIKSRWQTLNR